MEFAVIQTKTAFAGCSLLLAVRGCLKSLRSLLKPLEIDFRADVIEAREVSILLKHPLSVRWVHLVCLAPNSIRSTFRIMQQVY